jgi:hypothetical protein
MKGGSLREEWGIFSLFKVRRIVALYEVLRYPIIP